MSYQLKSQENYPNSDTPISIVSNMAYLISMRIMSNKTATTSGGFTNEGALRIFQNMGSYFKNNFLVDLKGVCSWRSDIKHKRFVEVIERSFVCASRIPYQFSGNPSP